MGIPRFPIKLNIFLIVLIVFNNKYQFEIPNLLIINDIILTVLTVLWWFTLKTIKTLVYIKDFNWDQVDITIKTVKIIKIIKTHLSFYIYLY